MMGQDILFIVARATNGCIAKDGDVPWAISEDLKRFKRLTINKPMVMGRKTFDSLPGLLPGRAHIVLTRDPDWSAKGALTANTVEQALELAKSESEDGDFSVIGGAEIFALLADHATRWEITDVHEHTDGDVFMDAPSPDKWIETARECHAAAGGFPPYDFVTYLRREASPSSCG